MKIEHVFLSVGLALALTAMSSSCSKIEDRPYKVQLVCKTNDRVTMKSNEVGFIRPPWSAEDDTYEFYRTYEERNSGPAIGRYRQRLGEYCTVYRVDPKPAAATNQIIIGE